MRDILTPFLVAAAISYLFYPIVTYYRAKGIKKGIVILGIFLVCIIIMVELFLFMIPRVIHELVNMKDTLPQLASEVKNILVRWQTTAETFYPPLKGKSLPDLFTQKIYASLEGILANIPHFLSSLFNLFSLFVLIPFITFFLLLDGEKFADWLFGVLPSRHVETVLSIISEINQVMRDFIHGQLLRLFWLTVIIIIGLLYLKVDFAYLFALFAGVANIIPVIGVWLGAAAPVLWVLFKYGLASSLKVALFFFIVEFVDNTFLTPYYLAKSVNLHFVLVILAMMIGGEIFGFIGVILAAPIASIIKVVIQIIYTEYRYKQALISRN